MTATQTITVPTESSPPPAGRPTPPRRRKLLAAGLLVVLAAAIALTVWLLTTSSPSQPGPITPISAAAPQQLPPWAPGDVNAVANPGSLDSSAAGYAQFCQNSPVLCGASAAPKSLDTGYVQFCQNSPALCTKPN